MFEKFCNGLISGAIFTTAYCISNRLVANSSRKALINQFNGLQRERKAVEEKKTA